MTGFQALLIAVGEVCGIGVGVLIGWFGHIHYRAVRQRAIGEAIANGDREYTRDDYPTLPPPVYAEGHHVGRWRP